MEHISSGDFFRAEVVRGTSLGAAFESRLKRGEFIPDDLTLAVMKKWFFARKRAQGFLLDGFPRNLLQAKVFDDWLDARREVLSACIYLDLPLEEALMRITQRRVCPADGAVYHNTFYPPRESGRCDRCGGPLIQRSDDTEETIRHRWDLFERHTLPLVSYYKDQGLLLSFDASVSLEQLQREVFAAVQSLN
jgi:adenylate kinase